MSDTLPPAAPLWPSLRKLGPHLEGRLIALSGVVALALSIASISAFEPLVLRAVFDSFLQGRQLSSAAVPLALLIGASLARDGLGLVQERLFWKTRLAINFSLLRATVERLHSLPLAYHRDQSVGATMTKIERGIAGAISGFTEVLLQLFPALVYLAVSVIVMFQIDARLAGAVLVFAPLPAIVGAFAAKEQTLRERNLMQLWTHIFARFNEVLTGIVVVKSFVMEEQEKRRFLGGVEQANAVVLRGVVTDSRYGALRSAIMSMARIVALGLGGLLVMKGQVTLGTLMAFVSYLGSLFLPVQTLTGLYQTLRKANVSVQSLLSILEAQESMGDEPGARAAGRLRGEVEFRNVTFGYRSATTIIQNVNLRVRAGEVIALVGPSGAGKTTMMALLQRLYDPNSGQILLDGEDLRCFTQRSVRSQIGVVLQEGTLFSDTIRDNIAFGREQASDAEIEAAARSANAHCFISALPQGYATQAGERGSKLSGGERQRIAIARALLKDAPILILDEATSALDAENEEKVQQAIERLSRGRTTFVIAHRLSTVTSADRIVVFKEGGIAEIGSHQELLRQNGYYASLVRRQARGLDMHGRSSAPAPRSSKHHPSAPRLALDLPALEAQSEPNIA
jgi:ATP-binding cassette subfamily B protein